MTEEPRDHARDVLASFRDDAVERRPIKTVDAAWFVPCHDADAHAVERKRVAFAVVLLELLIPA